jgi:tRNA/tmRNA/rRNA uracil-C5-methylase (TrmA/RlmC/RlmD family)
MRTSSCLPAGCEPACPGCQHRELSPTASLARKQAYLERVLGAWAPCLEAVEHCTSQDRLGYRDRVTLSTGWDPVAGWRFGLRRGEHLVAIHACPIHTARVRALLRVLAAVLPPPRSFPLAYLHVAGAQATLIVKARHAPHDWVEQVAPAWMRSGGEGLWLHLHPCAGRRLFARSGWQLLAGCGRSRDAEGFRYGPRSFQQPLPGLHARALDAAQDFLDAGQGDAVLDLYCGIGKSLRRWTARGAEALGVELAGEAVDCARHNVPDAVILRGCCRERLPQIERWWRNRSGRRLAFVNPDRAGLEERIRVALCEHLRPRRLAYLSCSAGTLARDVEQFTRAGYRPVRLLPFDFFPMTHHVEVLALLARA